MSVQYIYFIDHAFLTGQIELVEFVYPSDQELSTVLAMPGGEDGRSPSFCVGAVHYLPEELEPSTGSIKLLALAGDEGTARLVNPTLRVVATEQTPGCVYALAYVKGMIAAAVNTSVRIT